MRKKLLVTCGLFALVGTIAVAAVLGIAGTGKAASTNTCALVGGTPNCLTVGVFPGQLSPTGKGLIVAKFVNQGSATATHTMITVNLPSNVTAVSPPCPLSSTPSGTAVTCSLGNIAGFGTAKVSVQFTTTAAAGAIVSGISSSVTYAEGNGSNGNDTFSASGNSISIVNGTSVAGTCTGTTAPAGLLSTSLNDQTTRIDSLSVGLTGLPCTPIAGGVLPNDTTLTCGAAKCTSPFSFVILPTTGTATLIIPVSALANGMNATKFVLYWFPDTGVTAGTPLMRCADTQALPPAGTPKATPGTDTCIQSQTDLKIGNVKYVNDVLTIYGTSLTLTDAKFAG
jgi:hypothetical protein